MAHRVNKTYTPRELRDAVTVMEQSGIPSAERVIRALYVLGYRVIYTGRRQGERGEQQRAMDRMP